MQGSSRGRTLREQDLDYDALNHFVSSGGHCKEINELNSYLPELLKDMENVTLLDIGPKFLDEKGHLSAQIMPDTTLPSEKGYEIWAKAIEPELRSMLGE